MCVRACVRVFERERVSEREREQVFLKKKQVFLLERMLLIGILRAASVTNLTRSYDSVGGNRGLCVVLCARLNFLILSRSRAHSKLETRLKTLKSCYTGWSTLDPCWISPT